MTEKELLLKELESILNSATETEQGFEVIRLLESTKAASNRDAPLKDNSVGCANEELTIDNHDSTEDSRFFCTK